MKPARQPVRESGSALEFSLRVLPRARREGVAGFRNGALNIRVKAPPVDGRANEAARRLLSELLALPKSRIQIVSGEKSRQKVVRIEGFTTAELLRRLEALPGAPPEEVQP